MNDVEFLADQLQRAYRGEAWHGPSLRENLAGVTLQQARAKPSEAVHNIWEIVMHVGAWVCAVRRRLAGEILDLSPEQDWPAIDGGSEAAWQQTLAALDQEQNRLFEAIRALPAESLKKGVAGLNYSVRFMLEGVIQHNLYHAGQIALIKKMV
jgi:uncharacterized damage-inducible protein DinB